MVLKKLHNTEARQGRACGLACVLELLLADDERLLLEVGLQRGLVGGEHLCTASGQATGGQIPSPILTRAAQDNTTNFMQAKLRHENTEPEHLSVM